MPYSASTQGVGVRGIDGWQNSGADRYTLLLHFSKRVAVPADLLPEGPL